MSFRIPAQLMDRIQQPVIGTSQRGQNVVGRNVITKFSELVCELLIRFVARSHDGDLPIFGTKQKPVANERQQTRSHQ